MVGESGCGKSVTALAIMNILSASARMPTGEILYYKDGKPTNIAAFRSMSREMLAIRGAEISMIFQEPMSSFCPVYTVGYQIAESLRYHRDITKEEAKSQTIELLGRVGIASPERRYNSYPFELSGGMCQRAMIAMALIGNPAMLIADEPTTALDVTIQAQIINLMKDLQAEYGMSMLFITHDLGVISDVSDDVVVMYLGHVVEEGPVSEVFDSPEHPYTVGLMSSIPSVGYKGKLNLIEGSIPSPFEREVGCPFRNRCPYVMERCSEMPPLFKTGEQHLSRCWLYEDAQVE
jgi:oligopeptide/dipeptide ABC transporter ATP-binding protein